MKVRRHNSLNSLLATLLVVVAAAGCVEPIDITPPEVTDDVELTFQIAIPSAGIMTKAENIAAVENESKIYDLQVWAFTNGGAADETAVGYTHPDIPADGWDPTDLANAPTITMKLPSRVVNGENPKLDFYALANGPSVGFTAVKYPPRSTSSSDDVTPLQDATFGKNATATPVTDYFGATTPTSAVPATGLPMSCYYAANFDVSFLRYGFTSEQLKLFKDDKPTSRPTNFSEVQWAWASAGTNWNYDNVCPKIQLTRSIAKIRFVFTKAESMADDQVQIVSIALVNGENGNMLPPATYVFPHTSPEYSGHEAFSWTGSPLVANDGIQTVDTPLRLRKDCETVMYDTEHDYAISTVPGDNIKTPKQMTAQQYEKLLDKSIEAKKTASQKILYLRESDKNDVKCKIGYQFKNKGATDFGAINYATIDIPKDPTAPSKPVLTRNTWWTVYAYFISYELGFQVTVAPWKGGIYNDQALEE